MPLPFSPVYCVVEEPEPHVLVVRFNRPKAFNSVPPSMHAELTKIWKYYDAAADLWVAICTGEGKAFSAGFDLKSAAGASKHWFATRICDLCGLIVQVYLLSATPSQI